MRHDLYRAQRLLEVHERLSDYSDFYKHLNAAGGERKHHALLDEYMALDTKRRRSLAFLLTKTQLQELIGSLPDYLLTNPDNDLSGLLLLRYRRYVFWKMYYTWQDHYLNLGFCKLFLRLIEAPNSARFLPECGYDSKTLKDIVLSEDPANTLIQKALLSQYGLIGYLDAHYHHRSSRISLDSMSVYYLFCTEKDYLDIGDLRLVSVIERFPERSQIRILKNMLVKIMPDRLPDFEKTLSYFKQKYGSGQTANDMKEILGDNLERFRQATVNRRETECENK